MSDIHLPPGADQGILLPPGAQPQQEAGTIDLNGPITDQTFRQALLSLLNAHVEIQAQHNQMVHDATSMRLETLRAIQAMQASVEAMQQQLAVIGVLDADEADEPEAPSDEPPMTMREAQVAEARQAAQN